MTRTCAERYDYYIDKGVSLLVAITIYLTAMAASEENFAKKPVKRWKLSSALWLISSGEELKRKEGRGHGTCLEEEEGFATTTTTPGTTYYQQKKTRRLKATSVAPTFLLLLLLLFSSSLVL